MRCCFFEEILTFFLIFYFFFFFFFSSSSSSLIKANDIAQCFAAGALLSTSFFLIFPEAIHHLKKAHPNSDVQQTIVFGSTTLTGVVLSMIISMLCSLLGAPSAIVQKKQIEMKDIENNDTDTEQKECNNKNNHVAFALTALPKKPFCQCRPSEWTVSKVKRMCIVLYLSLVFLKLKLKSILNF